jgi:RNA polymerase sigma factor (sigma-70 family)
VTTAVSRWDIVGPSDSDAALARASAAGDKRAFADIYDRYADRLHDFCVGLLADRDGAADCVQDTFCIAAARLPQLRDPDKLRPWLYSIARNEALRRIRQRRRETPSEELPDTASGEPGPDTLAARMELSELIADAAGGLSDRDRAVLELAFRHGLNGPYLAEALGVSASNANTIVHRLRETIQRSLGALLVSRRVRSAGGCAELAAILDGWDGHFNVLMRKRISRHIESCDSCDEERRRLVSPVALLGATPVFVPAPAWLRERTLNGIELTSASTPKADNAVHVDRNTHGSVIAVVAFVVALLAAVGMTLAFVKVQTTTVPAPMEVGESAPPPPPVRVEQVAPSTQAPLAPWPTAAPQPATKPTVVAPRHVSEPPMSQSPASEPPPPPPVSPPLPPLPRWPQWPPWPGGGPGGPSPGGQFAGPSGIAIPPAAPSVP